ncbi:MAG TPA: G1 family glutamic endopeptidase [Streptosporangiaceae bacterium]
MRRPCLLNLVLLACLPAAGMLLTFGPAAGASTAATHSAQAAANARALLHNLSVGQHSADQRVAGHATKIEGLTQVQSTNWSGYADTGSGFSTVTAHWTEPSASCGSTTSLAAFWVGIDGYSSSSVEQDGTLVECYLGTAYQYTWWEMYPTNAIQVVGSTLAAGDSITASVVRSGTRYTLKVTDSTHSADSFSTTQTCSGCANSSAEWIAEAPSGSSGVYPLSHFSTWTASSATVTGSSGAGVISSYPDDEITMINSSGQVKAQPGALNSSGNGFSVAWERAS